MPSFCRHNRLLQSCSICSREQGVEMRPVVSSPTPAAGGQRAGAREGGRAPGRRAGGGGARRRSGAGAGAAAARGVRVSRLARGLDDGFSSALVPGLRSSEDAERLAAELAFAARRLQLMEREPPGLWAEVAAGEDVEERTWLAFLIAFVGPAAGEDPFAAVAAARVSWTAAAAGAEPRLEGVQPGPRGALEPGGASATIAAYRAWVARAGSQRAAFTGEQSWTPERRFERLFERLSLPGLHRDARFELLVSLGRLGGFPLRAGRLELGGENEATWAAKRAFGIGQTLLLERRAAELASACGAPLEALDLGLHNWGSGTRFGGGLAPGVESDPALLAQARAALGL